MPHNFTDQEGLAELSQQLSEAEHLLLIGPHCANQTWELAVPGAEESGERWAHAGPLQNTGECQEGGVWPRAQGQGQDGGARPRVIFLRPSLCDPG